MSTSEAKKAAAKRWRDKQPPGARTTGWIIDHDHTCCPANRSCAKCRRGVLCHPCNSAIGLLQDSPAVLRAAIDYLERHGK